MVIMITMDTGLVALVFIILLRGLLPFIVFKWPFWGGISLILADMSDVMVFQAFGSGPLRGEHYHNFDKFFDSFYLFFEFLVVWRWKNTLMRRTGKILFLWRMVGFAVFEVSSLFGVPLRAAFLLAPNIFENFYLAGAFLNRYKPRFKIRSRGLIIILLLVGIPKIIQEYIMHYLFVDQTWGFIRDNFFFWLYNL